MAALNGSDCGCLCHVGCLSLRHLEVEVDHSLKFSDVLCLLLNLLLRGPLSLFPRGAIGRRMLNKNIVRKPLEGRCGPATAWLFQPINKVVLLNDVRSRLEVLGLLSLSGLRHVEGLCAVVLLEEVAVD